MTIETLQQIWESGRRMTWAEQNAEKDLRLNLFLSGRMTTEQLLALPSPSRREMDRRSGAVTYGFELQERMGDQ